MPDLLAHALLGFIIGTALSWRYRWIDSHWVTVVVVGTFVPDIVKIRLLVPSDLIASLLGGVPFSWTALHTGGPVLLSILVGALVVAPRYKRPAFALLSLGAASHLVADALILNPSGQSYAVFWPLTRYHPPSPGLYVSAQLEPTLVAAVVAGAIWLIDRRLSGGAAAG